ncbi:MAG: hypothetical protein HYR73_05370, partial [Candidatus Eisenbacteria bacterium]|nr:hypothetical protein [Candidatus Eisenbacteria bacterium]
MPQPAPLPPEDPAALHTRAMDNLSFIRRTMEGAASFTAVPGWGQVMVGTVALVTAPIAARQGSPGRWLITWLVAAVLGASIGVVSMALKARAAGQPLLSEPGRRFALNFALPGFAAAALTVPLARAGMFAMLPGMWLLLHGVAIATGGTVSVPIVPLLGACFMALGLAGLVAHVPPDLLMA